MRNKMIELIREAKGTFRIEEMYADIDSIIDMPSEDEYIADHLIANGVTIIPECKGCVYANRKRPQKCSCCRRNKDMADLFKPESPKGE